MGIDITAAFDGINGKEVYQTLPAGPTDFRESVMVS